MDVGEMHSLLLKLSREASGILRDAMGDRCLHEIVGANSPRDVTRRVDLLSEDYIVEGLRREHAPALLVTEEKGTLRLSENPEYVVLVDPLDGSNNYISGIPYFSVSVAYGRYSPNARMKDLVGGIVVDVLSERVYHARVGWGAFVDGSRIKKYKPPGLPMILGYLNGDAYTVFHRLEQEWGTVKLRSLGSAALDLVHVAMGGAEVFADLRAKLRIVDVAGGYVVLREMGGVVYTGYGDELNPRITSLERVSSIVAYTDEDAARKYWRIIELFREVTGEG